MNSLFTTTPLTSPPPVQSRLTFDLVEEISATESCSMDPNLWASLRSNPDSRRNGHPTGNEQTFSLAQSAVGLDLQLLLQQQRLASGFSAGFPLLPAAYGNYNIQCSTAAGNLYLPYNPLSTGEDGIAAGAQFTFPTQPQFETLLKAQQQTIQQLQQQQLLQQQQQQQQQQHQQQHTPTTANSVYTQKPDSLFSKQDSIFSSQTSKPSSLSVPKRPAQSLNQPTDNSSLALNCRSYAGNNTGSQSQLAHSIQNSSTGPNIDILNQSLLMSIPNLASKHYESSSNKQHKQHQQQQHQQQQQQQQQQQHQQQRLVSQSHSNSNSLPGLDLSQLTNKSTAASSSQSRPPTAHLLTADPYTSCHTQVMTSNAFKATPANVTVASHLADHHLVDQSTVSLHWAHDNQMNIGSNSEGYSYENVSPAPMDQPGFSFVDTLQLLDCTNSEGVPVYLTLQQDQNVTNLTGVEQNFEQTPSYYADKLSTVDATGINQCRQIQKSSSKPGTEVGVVLPIPQSRSSTKQQSSNPLVALPQFDLNMMDMNSFERDYYGVPGVPVPVSYLSDNLSKDDAGCGADDARSNSAIVLSNITGNIYINQYSMLQPDGSENPLLHPVGLSYDAYGQPEEEKIDNKTTMLLVPNERDDEFGHLTATAPAVQPEPSVPQLGCQQSEPLISPKISKAIPKSAFENSFLKFVCGQQTETLSSVTNSPIKNRPPLPKYIPEVKKELPKKVETPAEPIEPSVSKNEQPALGSQASVTIGDGDTGADKSGGVVMMAAVTSAVQQSPSITVSPTKFPAKFSHKLQNRAAQNALAESAAASTAKAEESSTTKGFKWKKMIPTSAANETISITSKCKTTSTLSANSHSEQPTLPKGKRPASSVSTQDSNQGNNKMTAQQVQWTVSKKPKNEVDDESAARVPVLVIKAIPSASTETKPRKTSTSSRKPSK